MTETKGKSDGGGRGSCTGDGRTELWAPPDIGSAHPASRLLYGVPIPARAARSKATASPSTAASSTSSTCPPTTVEKFRHSAPAGRHWLVRVVLFLLLPLRVRDAGWADCLKWWSAFPVFTHWGNQKHAIQETAGCIPSSVEKVPWCNTPISG